MAGKRLVSSYKGNRKLRRSLKFGVGAYEGLIQSVKYKLTQSKKEAIEILICNPRTKMSFTYLVVLKSSKGEFLVDALLDIYGDDEADVEDLVGLVVGFETELNGSYINLKSFYKVDTEFEEELEEELELEEEEYDDDDLEEE